MSALSGTVGLLIKVTFLALLDAAALWAGLALADQKRWGVVALEAAATIALNVVLANPRRLIPSKFLLPGVLFLLIFQIVPIVYTVSVAFTNEGTAHVSSKADAIQAILDSSLAEDPNADGYAITPARDASGHLVILAVDNVTLKPYVGTSAGLTALAPASVTIVDGAITASTTYRIVPAVSRAAIDKAFSALRVPTADGAIQPQGFDTAMVLLPTMRYDGHAGTFTRLADHHVFRDNGRGSFEAPNHEQLLQGWTAGVGFHNFARILTNRQIRQPLLGVFAWTMTFAVSTVVLQFVVGLFFAIVLDRRGLRFQKIYRSLIIVPYAIPGFLLLLVWAGLLNEGFGAVNAALGRDIPWLTDTNWARFSVIMVNSWLGIPYFFLVSMGALQAIPADLSEAAIVDGAGRWAIFRRVRLPLLLVATSPLLIASFAYNFNNFNTVYLLTAGGPPSPDSAAGGTDLLITYTYQIAIAAGKGNDYALASTVAILIFFVVAGISAVSFWRTNSLENLA